MRITDTARDAILKVMKSKGLDPGVWALEFGVQENGVIGLGFNKTSPPTTSFGELKLTVDSKLDTEGVVVDYGVIEGRKGLIFLSEEYHGRDIEYSLTGPPSR